MIQIRFKLRLTFGNWIRNHRKDTKDPATIFSSYLSYSNDTHFFVTVLSRTLNSVRDILPRFRGGYTMETFVPSLQFAYSKRVPSPHGYNVILCDTNIFIVSFTIAADTSFILKWETKKIYQDAFSGQLLINTNKILLKIRSNLQLLLKRLRTWSDPLIQIPISIGSVRENDTFKQWLYKHLRVIQKRHDPVIWARQRFLRTAKTGTLGKPLACEYPTIYRSLWNWV